MVPSAVDAHLDEVTREAVVGGGELGQPRRGVDDPATVSLELVSVDVPHPAQRLVGANRALSRNCIADVLGCPQQLGMGIADIRGVEPPSAQRRNRRAPSQRVVHHRPDHARRPVRVERSPRGNDHGADGKRQGGGCRKPGCGNRGGRSEPWTWPDRFGWAAAKRGQSNRCPWQPKAAGVWQAGVIARPAQRDGRYIGAIYRSRINP